MKIIRIKLSPEAEEVYRHLNREAPNSKTERMILKAINLKKRKIHIPLMFTKIIAYFCEKLSGAHPVITLEQVYTINQKEMWGIEREKKELGYNPIDLDVDIIKKIL